MAEPRQLKCVVVSPERQLLDTTADYVTIPLYDGELGVLPGRAPLIGRLGFGEVRIRKEGKTQRLFVDGGFAQVRDNVVTVLTARAQKPEEIKPDAVREALAKSIEGLKTAKGTEEQDALLVQQQKCRLQLRVAEQAKA
jgi:F-type H+-transporting ATPase subunit epsilon